MHSQTRIPQAARTFNSRFRSASDGLKRGVPGLAALIVTAVLFLALLAPGGRLEAQISMSVKPERSLYLAHESLWIKVHVTNFSGRALHFQKDSNWLQCFVESRDGFIVNKLKDVKVDEDVYLPNAKKAVITLNIEPNFDLTRQGRYELTAMARIPDWDEEIRSNPAVFDIGKGVTIWSQKFGIPARFTPGSTGRPEIRQYALLQYTELDKMILYFQLADESGARVYRVFPIGTTVSFGRLNWESPIIDSLGRLHVLHQYDAKLLSYQTFNHEGERIRRETYRYFRGSKPRLETNGEGEVGVVGGIRMKHRSDLSKDASD